MPKVKHSPPTKSEDHSLSAGCSSSESGSSMAAAVKKRKNRNFGTDESDISVSYERFTAEIRADINSWRLEMNNNMSKLSDSMSSIKNDIELLSSVTKQIQNDMNLLRSDHLKLQRHVSTVEKSCAELTLQVSDLRSSNEFTAAQQLDLENRVKDFDSRFKYIEDFISKSPTLEERMDNLDQSSRQYNIELSNVPEKRAENLLLLIEKIGKCINVNIPQKEVVSIHRVPHMLSESKTPKNIIVKLSSSILRNNILSAFRLAKGLKSDQIGIGGTACKIFLNEHLILSRKLLFREARETAKKCHYKHAWVRNANIFVRKTDTSPTLKISCHEDLKKITISETARNDNQSQN